MNKTLCALLFITGNAYAAGHLDFPAGVSAVTDRAVICAPGYSAAVRPPASYTNKIKRSWLPAGHTVSEFELDHYIPIGLGGSPTDPNNMWLQYWASAKRKDAAEAKLHRDMCKGIYTPQQAQSFMRAWK